MRCAPPFSPPSLAGVQFMNNAFKHLFYTSFLVAALFAFGCSGTTSPLSPGLASNEPPSMDGVTRDGITFNGVSTGAESQIVGVEPGSAHIIFFMPAAEYPQSSYTGTCTAGSFFVNGEDAGDAVKMDNSYVEWHAPDGEGYAAVYFDDDQGDPAKWGVLVVVKWGQPDGTVSPAPITRESEYIDPFTGQSIFAADGEFLVKMKDNQPLTEVMNLRAAQDYSVLEKISTDSPIYRIRLNTGSDFTQAWNELAADPRIDVVEPNYLAYPTVVPDDPDYGKKHEFPKIEAESAWDIATGSENVWVAVIDTGVDRDHPDLVDNVIDGLDFIIGGDGLGGETPGDGVDNNNDGLIDNNTGHGTHVAGTIAAMAFNGNGACGIAYNTKILPLRIFPTNGDTGATFSSIIEAVNYAADVENVRVISMSIGTTYESSLLQSAINSAWNKGKVLVAAAANANTNQEYFPGAHDNVLAVAAINKSGEKASFSNYGSWVDVSAYGTAIYSTFYNDQYTYMSGTSMATPLVSGCIALLFSYNPNLTNDQAVDIITTYVSDVYELNPEYPGMLGSGLVNPFLALDALSNSEPGQLTDANGGGGPSDYTLQPGPGSHG